MLDVRKCFIPRKGCYWLFADYSQIEARIYADEFEEPTMLDAFNNGEDVYVALQHTIDKHTGVDVGRQVAKNIFLGKIYGLGLEHLVEMIMDESHTDVDSYQAQHIIEAFNKTFPIVAKSMNDTATMAEQMGFIRNRFGQVVNVPYETAYKGVNYIIQSTAQRVIKNAMLRMIDNGLSVNLLLQVHDELIFEFPKHVNRFEIAEQIKEIMEIELNHLWLTVDFEWSDTNWLEQRGMQDDE